MGFEKRDHLGRVPLGWADEPPQFLSFGVDEERRWQADGRKVERSLHRRIDVETEIPDTNLGIELADHS